MNPVQTLYQWAGGSPLLAYPSCIASLLRLESVKRKQIVGLFGLEADKFWTQDEASVKEGRTLGSKTVSK